jgi:hypothetical protein
MNDQTFALPTLRARTNFIVVIFVLHIICNVAMFLWGDPKNSLHTSMLAWEWGAFIVLIPTFLFGINVDMKNFFATFTGQTQPTK